MIDEKKIYNYIKELINPYGKPFEGTSYELGNKIMDYIKNMEKIGEWIPCSERLPENISTVIVQVKEIEKPTFGWYGSISGWRLIEIDFVELKGFTVIAWQQLPEPYKEE